MLDSFEIPAKRPLSFIPDPKKRQPVLWGVGVGVMGLFGIAAIVLAPSSEAQGDDSSSLADAAGGDADEDESVLASARPNELPAEQPASAETDGGPDEEKPAAPEPAADTPEPEAQPEPEAEAGPEPKVAPRPRPRREIKPMSPGAYRHATRIARQLESALAQGQVKTSDLSFAVFGDREGSAWDEAEQECRAMMVDGVGGWRLASRGELRDLGRARLLASGMAYWSRSGAADPDAAYVFNTRTRRSAVRLKQEPTAATVCVQPRPRRSPATSPTDKPIERGAAR